MTGKLKPATFCTCPGTCLTNEEDEDIFKVFLLIKG